MSRFLEALHSGRVLLMDGAMGTQLLVAGLKPGERGETWNVIFPNRVRAIHQAYVAAGAEVLLTNTLLAYPGGPSNKPDDLIALGQAAINLARSAGGPGTFVLGDLGPLVFTGSKTEFPDLKLVRIAARYLQSTDAILLETCSSSRARYAVQAVGPSTTRLPVLLSLAYRRGRNGKLATYSGHSPEWFAQRARRYGAVALGVNCGLDIGMDEVLEIIRRYRQATDLPLFARPNAGTPVRRGRRCVYPCTPKAMAARLPELLEAGITLIGGCCGSTPKHIAAFRPIVDAWNAKHANRGTRP
jgi:5-methyltetrahydrofolate--homocysteine methyltransferase